MEQQLEKLTQAILARGELIKQLQIQCEAIHASVGEMKPIRPEVKAETKPAAPVVADSLLRVEALRSSTTDQRLRLSSRRDEVTSLVDLKADLQRLVSPIRDSPQSMTTLAQASLPRLFATGELDALMPTGCSMNCPDDDTDSWASAFMPDAASGPPSTAAMLDIVITSTEPIVAALLVRDGTSVLTSTPSGDTVHSIDLGDEHVPYLSNCQLSARKVFDKMRGTGGISYGFSTIGLVPTTCCPDKSSAAGITVVDRAARQRERAHRLLILARLGNSCGAMEFRRPWPPPMLVATVGAQLGLTPWQSSHGSIGTQIRSHAQKYILKVQKLSLAAGLPPQYPRHKFVMQQPQSSPAGSSVAATIVLHGQPQCSSLAMPDPSDIAVHGSIGWNCPGVLPVVNECFSDMQNFDWAGTSDTSAWVYHGAESQTEPAATYPSDNSFMGTPSFSNMSMDWAGNTSEALAIGEFLGHRAFSDSKEAACHSWDCNSELPAKFLTWLGVHSNFNVILKHFRHTDVLELHTPNHPDLEGYKKLMEEIRFSHHFELLPSLEPSRHALRSSMVSLIKRCSGLRKLLLFVRHTDGDNACSSDCICHQPSSWRDQNIHSDSLEELQVKGLRGTRDELDFLRCKETYEEIVSLSPEAVGIVGKQKSSTSTDLVILPFWPLSLIFDHINYFVNTYTLINRNGKPHLVKFHWKPTWGVKSLLDDEAVTVGGTCPSPTPKDLTDSIAAGNYPEWQLYIQTIDPDHGDRFGLDSLDVAKTWTEDIIPLQPVGQLVLNKNIDNCFAGDEQFASTMGLLLTYTLNITNLLTVVLRLASLAENSLNAVERVGTYIELPSEAPPVIEDNRPPPGWPSSGVIKFEDVVFRYRPELPRVLHAISFIINESEKVGIVGKTGAGKSSMLNALFCIVELERGRILIDDCDTSKFGIWDLRKVLGIIPQAPILFSGSVRFNLDPFNGHNDADL